jgi:hypothetical protein
MTSKELLTKAKKLIDKPKNWTQGAFARNEINIAVPVSAPNACQFCLLGAIERVCALNNAWPHEVVNEIYDASAKVFGASIGLTSLNDRAQDHEELMEKIDRILKVL